MRYERGRGWRDPGLSVDIDGDWRAQLAARAVRRRLSRLARGGGPLARAAASADDRLRRRQRPATLPASARVDAASAAPASAAFDALRPGDDHRGRAGGRRLGAALDPRSLGRDGRRGGRRPAGSSPCRAASTCAAADFNRATQALRQPGSTFKPIVYSAALDNGMTPASIIVDGPFCVYQGTPRQKCFRNFAGGYAGPQTMRWGLEQSRNLMTVRAANQIGMDQCRPTRPADGRRRLSPTILAIALGAGDTTVLQDDQRLRDLRQSGPGADADPDRLCPGPPRQGHLARRHAALRGLQRARLGRPADAAAAAADPPGGRSDDRLSDRPHARRRRPARHRHRSCAISAGRCSARPARPPARPTSGSSAARAEIVAGVYMGFDQPRPMGGYAQGGTLAAPIFSQFARDAFEGMPVLPFRAPQGIRMVRDRPPLGPARVRRLAGQRSARGGDLGGVQARERAAARRSRRDEIEPKPQPRADAAGAAPHGDRSATATSCKARAGFTSAAAAYVHDGRRTR